MVVRIAIILGLTLAMVAQVEARGASPAARRAFSKGQALYDQGKYQQSLESYQEAQRLAPHSSTLFNIARCYVNLNQPKKAIEAYQQSLALAKDAKTKADIKNRIERIRAQPVKIFVGTEPPGAKVTVDGRAGPEAAKTPLVLQLTPGEHVLLIHLDGYDLAVRRVLVKVGEEQTIQAALERKPGKCPPCPACPKCKKCPPPRRCPDHKLTRFEGLHLDVGLSGASMLAYKWGFLSGLGVQAHGSINRWFFGAWLNYLVVDLTSSKVQDVQNSNARLFAGAIEGGYVWPWRNFYLYASVGIGLFLDRITQRSNDPTIPVDATEGSGLLWALGGGAHAMILRWLSIGVALRGGAMHGKRIVQEELQKLDPGHFPYVTLWGVVAFHL